MSLRNELIKVEKSLLTQIHPAVVLEAILCEVPCVQFKTRLPNDVLVELKFGDDEVEVGFPYLAVTGDSIRLERYGTRVMTLVKLKDALHNINTPQRRLLKLSNSFLSCLGAWCQSPPYLNPVTVRIRRVHWSMFEPYTTFKIRGARLPSLVNAVCRAKLQWYVYLFNIRYGDSIVSQWESFRTHYR
ncbi:hypothetical protein DRO59_02290 [Candidatus Bathyarchaeota archaeon]|nr:MAG: hypothetical protein DRO59_02290 [Candidatus Bathyarchaeota archaeon]